MAPTPQSLRHTLIALAAATVLLVIVFAANFIVPRLLSLAPSSPTTTTVLDKFNHNDLDAALVDVDALLRHEPRNVAALLQKALILLQTGSTRYAEAEYARPAIALCEQVLTLDPNNSEAWRLIGYAHEISERYDLADISYQKSLNIDPNNARTLADRAHAFDLQGKLDQAAPLYAAAISKDPYIEKAYLGLGRIAVAHADLPGALAYFEIVAANSANDRTAAEAHMSAGGVASALNRHDTAVAHLRAAIARDPSYDSAWLGLARALFQISISTSSTVLTNEQRHALADQSFAALSTALTLNPALALAHYQLGFQLLTIGRATDAAKALHEADRFVATDITMSASEKTNTQALIRSALGLARSRAR